MKKKTYETPVIHYSMVTLENAIMDSSVRDEGVKIQSINGNVSGETSGKLDVWGESILETNF